jgi:4-aminobutyrate aminotransferase-like enzyme
LSPWPPASLMFLTAIWIPWDKAWDDNTCAVLLEPVLGEGGVCAAAG